MVAVLVLGLAGGPSLGLVVVGVERGQLLVELGAGCWLLAVVARAEWMVGLPHS